MNVQKDDLIEAYKEVKADSIDEAKALTSTYFKEKTWLYAVLDYAVGFGCYEKEHFTVFMGEQREPVAMDWKYVQELRIFNCDRELRLVPLEGAWVGRVRGVMPAGIKVDKRIEEYTISQCQKLWGQVKDSRNKYREGTGREIWSLLTSDRGTRIWVPLDLKEQEKAAVCVKKFMRIPTEEHQELVFQTDIRMVDFCKWEYTDGEEGRAENGKY